MKKLVILFIALLLAIPIFASNAKQKEYTHTVLLELGSLTTCPYCPAAIDALKALYESNEIPFYYVTLVYDKSDAARQRGKWLNDVYVPMLYVDGGYDVVDEANEMAYFNAVEEAAKRNVNNFDMQLNAKWNGNDIEIFLNITNEDSVPHFEHLRVYILEVESRWTDYNGDKIRYALMDYAFNTYVPLMPEKATSFQIKWSNKYDLERNNTMVLAYLSSWLPHIQKNPWNDPWWSSYFIAQFVDETVAMEL